MPVATADQPDRSAALSARGLSKVYGAGDVAVTALNAVDLDLYPGELVVLLGASGSGKSTLLNILGGLDTPSDGGVFFGDREITAEDDASLTLYRRDYVGFVFQFYNLIASLTARENVALVTEISENAMDPVEALALVGLEDRIDHFPAQLSGGEQQRVAIARAIAKQPAILLCDEPTGALDSKTGIIVLEAIERVNRELGTTTAIITHNSITAGIADRVIYLADGEITHIEANAERQTARSLAW